MRNVWKIIHCGMCFALFWFLGCQEKGPEIPKSMEISTEVAQMVTHATSGWMSPQGPIRIRFAYPMAEPEEISSDPAKPKKISKKIFAFSPSIKGFAYWEDPQTLVFKPSKALKSNTLYRGALDIARLLPAKREKKSELILPLEFKVTSLEILSFNADFELVDENNPKLVIYQGKIEFSESLPLEAIQNASGLYLTSKKWPLMWEKEPSGKIFRFKSQPITRDTLEKSLTFSIKKTELSLPSDFTKSLFLPGITEMKVVDFIVKTGDKETSIEIMFSDVLDNTKSDPSARIVILPEVQTKKVVMGNTIYLTGGFEFGKTYTIRVLKGIRSRWGTILKSDFEKVVLIDDIKPQMRFTSDGVFVPSTNEQKIRFETVNLRRVHLNIKKVFEFNLGQFLQTEELSGKRTRSEGFNHWEVRRVGVDVVNKTLEIGDKKNVWLQHELDLKELLKNETKELYLISLRFDRIDMMYKNLENKSEDYYYESNEPGSWSYMYRYGQIYKPVIFTDIGLTCKKAGQRFLVFATNLLNASPLSGVTVRLRTFQNQVLQEVQTNDQGVAEFPSISKEVFYLEAEKEGQRSALKLSEMAWNLSQFDIGGEQSALEGIRTFIYTDRGVYRPGDTLYIAVIARNEEGTFPDHHPLQVTIFNPLNQVTLRRTLKKAKEGFYAFSFVTNPEDPTGQWKAEFKIGGRFFTHPLRIETIVPYTLKVEIKPDKSKITPQDPVCTIGIEASTLFGAPAAHYPAKVEWALQRKPRFFPSFKNFVFDNPSVEFKSNPETLWSGMLNAEGKEKIQWKLPSLGNVPCGLEAVFTARVTEKSGRPNINTFLLPVDVYLRYVGIKPFEERTWIRTHEPIEIPVVLVDLEGKPVPGELLYYRVYQNRQYWWWEYESESVYRTRFKKDTETRLIKQGTIFSGEEPTPLSLTPEERGTYFLEVQDGKNGHIAGIFFSAYTWGEVPVSEEGAEVLVLHSDKNEYAPGEKAIIRFPCPNTGSILVTVEKGNTLLSYQWMDPPKSGNWAQVTIPTTSSMMPNVYVTVSVIQPHQQTLNDRPIRMYGVLPLRVSDPSTHQELQLLTPSYFEPGKECTVELQTKDNRPTQFTLAIVDQGLLALTQFLTPDPWNAFYKKERLGVNTYDLFSQVVGANKGDVFQTFSIGGSLEEKYRESQLGAEKVRRFKPVVIFKGPIFTDSRGHASITFTMPNYIGAVRIMAVCAKGKTYGSAEKTVPVKSDLMVQASLPRVFGVGDRIRMPVTVFAMEKNIESVKVDVSVKGPVMILGKSTQEISFSQPGEKEVFFELQAKPAVGTAEITVKATGGQRMASSTTEIAVRSSAPRLFESQLVNLERGKKVELLIPNKGIEGTNTAKLRIWRNRPIKLGSHLGWLIHYPYGCIEQTVSTVFPQLYLKVILADKKSIAEEIDKNIQGGIQRLRKFQLVNGAFSYWPGEKEASVWATDYAGRFLVEAKQLGYAVPEDMFQNWLSYEKQVAVSSKDPAFIKAHRLYLLALAGAPQMAPMNVLYEDSLKSMNDVTKWLLAGAYQLAGAPHTAQAILGITGTKVEETRFSYYWWCTYGTAMRDRALILEMAVLFERWPEANLIFDEMLRVLASDDWFSTQTMGHMLLAVGKYLKAREFQKEGKFSGTISLPEGKKVKFSTDQIQYTLALNSGFGKPIEVSLDGSSEIRQVFCELEWSGIPIEPEIKEFSKNLILSVEWRNENGQSIDISQLKQGTTFWGHFRASPRTAYTHIDNVALVQVLPAGWEIENIRLSGENLPSWTSGMNLNPYRYMDIRDDRIMWFFDFFPSKTMTLDFLVKLNAVTVGTFSFPPALLEAMYDANYQATKGGGKVVVEP